MEIFPFMPFMPFMPPLNAPTNRDISFPPIHTRMMNEDNVPTTIISDASRSIKPVYPLTHSARTQRRQVCTPSNSSSSMKKSGNLSQKKSVSFAPKSRCFIIPSLDHMSKDQKNAIWWTPREKRSNDDDVIKTVRAARRGRLPQFDETISTRGLEHLICPDTNRLLKARHADRINAVLDVQEREWQLGNLHASPKTIKRIARRYSRDDVNRAIMLAAGDEAYVRGLRRLDAKAA